MKCFLRSMNEFKFACPWCRQHMMCDMSQRGTVMQCPTCFHKVGAPMAPSPDAKYILTGTRIEEKKSAGKSDAGGDAADAKKKFPGAILAGVIVLALAAGAAYFFLGKKPVHPEANTVWQSSDIGNVGAAGAFSLVNGLFTVSGSGADIWGQADSFHFVFQALHGDGTLTARVLTVKNTDAWAKAGVMFRESLEANSAYALALVTPASGIAFQQRDHPGASVSEVLHVPNQAAPCWLRLARQGNTFTASSSVNGTSWTTMGSATIPMGSQAYAGLAVCSHNDKTLCQAQFDNVPFKVVSNATPAPAPPVVTPPVVTPPVAAPPANDTNWTMNLAEVATPNTPAVGRIHGLDFRVERAALQNGTLTLRAGSTGSTEFGVLIIFTGAQPEGLARKTINVSPEAEKAAPVQLRWKDNTGAQRKNFNSGYALRLEFGALANNRMPGTIYLCTPDPEKSYLMGTFTAAVSKPKPKAPATTTPAPKK